MDIRPATAADVWEWAVLAAGHALPRGGRVYRCLLAQAGVSAAYTLREAPGEAPLVIAGLLDLAPHEGEVWFLGPPGGRGGLGVRLTRVVRLAATWLDRVEARRSGGLVCYVRAGHRDGQRLARLLRFECTGVSDGLETWRRQ